MTIGRFRHFLAVADEASFGRAAARLGMKQPPLSQSVRRLERDLGVTLLERTSKGVTLTRAGDAFLPEARAAVAAAERAAALAREAAGPRRPVRVGFVAVAMWDILPSLLDAAHTADIPVRLYQDTTYNQLNALAEGRLDLGFVAPPFEAPSRLRVENLADEPVMVATPTALVPDEGGPVALAAIAGHLIMYPRSEGTVLYDGILAMFQTQGLRPVIVQESPQMLTTLALLVAGRGVSFVPAALSRTVSLKGVVFRSVDSSIRIPPWPVSLAHMPLSARSDTARLLAHWRHSRPNG